MNLLLRESFSHFYKLTKFRVIFVALHAVCMEVNLFPLAIQLITEYLASVMLLWQAYFRGP